MCCYLITSLNLLRLEEPHCSRPWRYLTRAGQSDVHVETGTSDNIDSSPLYPCAYVEAYSATVLTTSHVLGTYHDH